MPSTGPLLENLPTPALIHPACTCVTTDSALSITASAISIITLAYVLLLGVGYRVAAYQRAKDQSFGLCAEAERLRQQMNNLYWLNHSTPGADDALAKKLMVDASVSLRELEEPLAKGAKTMDGWYLIWRQVQHTRKRQQWTDDMAKIKAQVALYASYQTLASLVQKRHDAEDEGVRDERRKLRESLVQQMQQLPFVHPVDADRNLRESTF